MRMIVSHHLFGVSLIVPRRKTMVFFTPRGWWETILEGILPMRSQGSHTSLFLSKPFSLLLLFLLRKNNNKHASAEHLIVSLRETMFFQIFCSKFYYVKPSCALHNLWLTFFLEMLSKKIKVIEKNTVKLFKPFCKKSLRFY